MDISNYLPVGQANAVQRTITVPNGMFNGLAWRETNTATEASIIIGPGQVDAGTKWVISDVQIIAMLIPPAAP